MNVMIGSNEGVWLHARKGHTEKIREFLMRREASCVTVTEALCGNPSSHRKRGQFTVFSESGEVRSCIFHTPNGFVFPVISEEGLPRPGMLHRKLRSLNANLFCIMGLRRDVQQFQTLVGEEAVETVQYYHMHRMCAAPIPPQPLPEHMTVRRAGPEDAEALYPIQREYEIEEVVLHPERFDSAACMHQLKDSLRRQLVYAVENNGRFVAKAQTNARGIHWDQIGGVYTSTALRGQGIAGAIMRKLLRDLDREKRNSSLFVKQNNEPALRMYRRLGYSTSDEFTIAYYRGI